jgi:repressor LexA
MPDPQPKPRGRPRIASITEPQQRTLRAIEDWLRAREYPPTIQELADALGITPATTHAQVKQLERKGYIKRESRKARGLVLLRSPGEPLLDLVQIPLVGTVAAGRPLGAEENVLGHLLVERRHCRSSRCFALRVTGESMQDADIHDGDTVIVRQQPLAQHNDIVVALVDGEATVKRLYLQEQVIELRPENSSYRPISIGPDTDLRIVGKVLAVHRTAVSPGP